jgi:hypothetical protein
MTDYIKREDVLRIVDAADWDTVSSGGLARDIAALPSAPVSEEVLHKPGCPASGGYGHGKEECICGATKQPVSEEREAANNWPPRFKFTPEGIAALYLRKHFADRAGPDEVKELADLLRAPQQQAARVVELEEAVRILFEWYDRDGSVGGASNAFEDVRCALALDSNIAPPPAQQAESNLDGEDMRGTFIVPMPRKVIAPAAPPPDDEAVRLLGTIYNYPRIGALWGNQERIEWARLMEEVRAYFSRKDQR